MALHAILVTGAERPVVELCWADSPERERQEHPRPCFRFEPGAIEQLSKGTRP